MNRKFSWRQHDGSSGSDVGLGEIVALEQQGLLRQGGEGIGKAITTIKAGGMAPLAVPAPGPAGLIGMLGPDGNNLDFGLMKPQIEFAAPRLAQTRLDHHGGLENCGGGYQADRIVRDALLKSGPRVR